MSILQDGASFVQGDTLHQSAISTLPIELIIEQGVLSYPSMQSFTFNLVFWHSPYPEIYDERGTPVGVNLHDFGSFGYALIRWWSLLG
jgi:hypothetical protein